MSAALSPSKRDLGPPLTVLAAFLAVSAATSAWPPLGLFVAVVALALAWRAGFSALLLLALGVLVVVSVLVVSGTLEPSASSTVDRAPVRPPPGG